MKHGYEEILEGESYRRMAPAARHELICGRLHQAVLPSLADAPAARLLEMRSVVEILTGSLVRPDLAIVTTANNRLWLAAEVIDPSDHRIDTVRKKELYENARIPRLWMIDPRYNNVEVYSGGPHGLALTRILANEEKLTEALLPGFSIAMKELFAGE